MTVFVLFSAQYKMGIAPLLPHQTLFPANEHELVYSGQLVHFFLLALKTSVSFVCVCVWAEDHIVHYIHHIQTYIYTHVLVLSAVLA